MEKWRQFPCNTWNWLNIYSMEREVRNRPIDTIQLDINGIA